MRSRYSAHVLGKADHLLATLSTEQRAGYDRKEAQQAFALLVEVNGEVQGLNKRLSVLQAAGVQFNTLIQNALKEEAIIETKEAQEEED